MQLASTRPYGVAVVKGDTAVPVREAFGSREPSMIEVIEHYDSVKGRLEELSKALGKKLQPSDLLPPVPNPSKIWAAAANYRRGTEGLDAGTGRGAASAISKAETLEMIFLKPPSAIIGPEDTIVIPNGADTIFPELELCAVIGKKARKVALENALDVVFGYTIILDVTARGYGSGKNILATRNIRKGFATFAPIGPWITTADEIADPMQLSMRLWVNGDLVQSAKTDAMINNVPELISYLSDVGTLYPGDLVATGNPDAPDFQRKLEPGDRLTAEIEGIGRMDLYVRSEA